MPRIVYKPKKFRGESLDIIDQADAICRDYASRGYDLTLRQLYYQFVSRDLIPNTERSYKRLGSIINDARLAGRIDWNHMVDRTRNLKGVQHHDGPEDIMGIAARAFRLDKWADQPRRVEVWIEKEALVGVLDSVCPGLDIDYFACKGYVSQSEQWRAGRRIGAYLQNGQAVTILHLGDHDPSGMDMTRDIYERISEFVITDWNNANPTGSLGHSNSYGEIYDDIATHVGCDSFGYRDGAGSHLAFSVHRIALNMDQIEAYDPPPNPAKMTDARANDYVAEYGFESWELDALDPDVLTLLVSDHVEELRDDELWDAAVDEEARQREILTSISESWDDVADFLS